VKAGTSLFAERGRGVTLSPLHPSKISTLFQPLIKITSHRQSVFTIFIVLTLDQTIKPYLAHLRAYCSKIHTSRWKRNKNIQGGYWSTVRLLSILRFHKVLFVISMGLFNLLQIFLIIKINNIHSVISVRRNKTFFQMHQTLQKDLP